MPPDPPSYTYCLRHLQLCFWRSLPRSHLWRSSFQQLWIWPVSFEYRATNNIGLVLLLLLSPNWLEEFEMRVIPCDHKSTSVLPSFQMTCWCIWPPFCSKIFPPSTAKSSFFPFTLNLMSSIDIDKASISSIALSLGRWCPCTRWFGVIVYHGSVW